MIHPGATPGHKFAGVSTFFLFSSSVSLSAVTENELLNFYRSAQQQGLAASADGLVRVCQVVCKL